VTRAAATQAERLTRIETLLETMIEQQAERRQAMHERIEEMAADIRQIKADVSADKADLASLKNKGTGLLIGAAVAGGAGWEAVKAIVGSVIK
jgi:DNA-binding protein H-NS